MAEVLATSTPISTNGYFCLNCNDETNKSKVFWLFTTFQFHVSIRFYIIILFKIFLHKFRSVIKSLSHMSWPCAMI
jgi:hypothetical protein